MKCFQEVLLNDKYYVRQDESDEMQITKISVSLFLIVKHASGR